MSTFEELKNILQQKEDQVANPVITQASLEKVIRARVNQHTKSSFQYFWASFTLQLIVYALLSHVLVKYGQNQETLYLAIPGILLYIPFTVVLLKKFKKLAAQSPLQQKDAGSNLYDYVSRQRSLLGSFYNFKKWYEFFLVPLSCAIGVSLVFDLYVPGGVYHHWQGALITLFLSLTSCIAAIYSENKKSFIRPMRQLQTILNEFEQKD